MKFTPIHDHVFDSDGKKILLNECYLRSLAEEIYRINNKSATDDYDPWRFYLDTVSRLL